MGDIGEKNPYAVLEIDEDASAEEVKNAFKRMALKYHPDKIHRSNSMTSSSCGSDDTEREERVGKHTARAKEKEKTKEFTMQDVNEAYETLRDPEKRRLYDMRRRACTSSLLARVMEMPLLAPTFSTVRGWVWRTCWISSTWRLPVLYPGRTKDKGRLLHFQRPRQPPQKGQHTWPFLHSLLSLWTSLCRFV